MCHLFSRFRYHPNDIRKLQHHTRTRRNLFNFNELLPHPLFGIFAVLKIRPSGGYIVKGVVSDSARFNHDAVAGGLDRARKIKA